jgi:hypothetical protein
MKHAFSFFSWIQLSIAAVVVIEAQALALLPLP